MRKVPLVLASDWYVSKSEAMISMCTGSVRDEAIRAQEEGRAVTLKVYKTDDTGKIIYHPRHNGRTFKDRDTADAYCLAFGLLQPYISRFAA